MLQTFLHAKTEHYQSIVLDPGWKYLFSMNDKLKKNSGVGFGLSDATTTLRKRRLCTKGL